MNKTDLKEIVRNVPEGMEKGLRNYWYPVLQSQELGEKPVVVRILGEDMVAWRDKQGMAHLFPDYCPHRKVRLSLGKVVDDSLQCPFHGMRFNGEGSCTFIPWEPINDPKPQGFKAQSFPTAELRGLIFAFIGETEKFPAPPARDELPAELFDDDTMVGYPMVEVWKANWLMAIDGVDTHHLPILHWSAVMDYNSVPDKMATSDEENRRIGAADGPIGLVQIVDGAGKVIEAGKRGHESEDLFNLPVNFSLAITGRPGTKPYHIYLWFVPIDAESTRVIRYVCRKSETAEERAEWHKFFHEVTMPRTLKVSSEDKMVAEGQRSLAFAREGERLFKPDAEIMRRRLFLRDAFIAQLNNERHAPVRTSLK